MERVIKGATGTALSGLVVGVSYCVDLFYRLTVLADPRWPQSVQKTALLFSLLVGLGVSVACAGYQNERLLWYFKRLFAISIGLLAISFILYLAVEVPFVSSQGSMIVIDAIWKVVDVAAMAFIVATVSFGSLAAGSSLWSLFANT